MNKEFKHLEREDVISINAERILISNPTFKVSEFTWALREAILAHLKRLNTAQDGWFTEGVNCKVLKPGAKCWQEGKVRITLEFCPDESETKEVETDESIFEDLRQLIDKVE